MPTNVGNPAQGCPLKDDHLPDQPQDPKKQFIKFKLVDDKGAPLENVQLNVTLPDGSSEEKVSDKDGMIEITNIDPGTCTIDFDWKEVTVDDVVLLQ